MKKLILLLLLLPFALFANVAKVVAFSGEATIVRGDENIKVTSGIELLKSDVIKTSDNTKLQLIFKDETVVTIGKNSEFKINDYIFDEEQNNYNANLGLMQGTFRTITGKIGKVAPNKFKLNSKSASIGIRGTQILSNVELSGDTIYCTEGAIEITSQLTGETIQIQAGQFVQIKEDEPIVVQEFSLEDIDTIETETQFTSQEEKEQVLESFSVEIEQVEPLEQTTQETQEDNQPIISEVNDNSNTINESDTYDSIIEKTNNNSTTIEPTKGFVAIEYGRGLGKINDNYIFKINEDDYKLELKLNDFKTNFDTDEDYGDGQLIGTSFNNVISGSSTTFSEGYYYSKEDDKDINPVFNTEDDIQWGTWNATFSESVRGYWIYGNTTAVNEVQSLISAGTTATFEGYALGKGPEFNLTADNTSVNFSIDFGAQTLTGTFTVPIPYVQDNRTLDVSGNLTASGFTFSGTSGTTGSGNGSFYGSNASSVGGNFNLEKSHTYSGVFKAKKQ
jgi:hypothetical protein